MKLVAEWQHITELEKLMPLCIERDALVLYLEKNERDWMDHKVIGSMLIKAFTNGPFVAYGKLIKAKKMGKFIDAYANHIRLLVGLVGFMGRSVEKIVKLAFVHGFPDQILITLQQLLKVWNNAHKQRGFCWPGRSSSGVDPIVNSHTQQCGNFTGCTKKKKKKQTPESGRKKQTNIDLELWKSGRWSLGLLSILCIFVMANAKTLWKSYTATKNADSSGHHLHSSVSWLHAPGLTPNWLTLFILLFWSHRFLWHSSLCSLHTKVDKRVPLDTDTGQRCWR